MKRKQFDCVEMKRQAQRALRIALEGKTPEAQAAEIARRAARNPLWQDLLRRCPQPAGEKRHASRP